MLASWWSMTKIAGSASESVSGSISQRHGSADPDPDPPQNGMDPQHCTQEWRCRRWWCWQWTSWWTTVWSWRRIPPSSSPGSPYAPTTFPLGSRQLPRYRYRVINVQRYRYRNLEADPGCLSRVLDPNFFYPRSRIQVQKDSGSASTWKEFKYFIPKNLFLSSRKYDPGCSYRIRISWFFTYHGSWIQGSKCSRARIRIRNTAWKLAAKIRRSGKK